MIICADQAEKSQYETKRRQSLEEVRRLVVTVRWNKRLNVVGEVEEEVNVTIKENFA